MCSSRGTILLHLVTWNRKALETWQEVRRTCTGGGDEMHQHTGQPARERDAIGLRVEQVGPEVGWAYLARFTRRPERLGRPHTTAEVAARKIARARRLAV